MNDKPAPPRLKDMIVQVQQAIDAAKHLNTLSPRGNEIAAIAEDIKSKIELHMRAQNILFEAYLQTADAEKLAMDEMRGDRSEGVRQAFFRLARGMSGIAEAIEARRRHEETREPGDFR